MNSTRTRYGRAGRALAGALAVGLLTAAPGPAGGSAAQDDTDDVDDSADHTFPQATFADQGADIDRLTDGVQMTIDEVAPARAFTGPTSMLADPSDARVIVAATANLRNQTCYLLRSVDAGSTWSILDALPAPEDYPRCTSSMAGVAQASLAWGSDGRLYYGLLAYSEGENARDGSESIALATSTDRGDSWTTTLVEDNRVENRDDDDLARSASGVTGIAVDTSGAQDVVHVAYSQSFADLEEDDPLNDNPVVVATSTDGGATFGEAVNINDFSEVTEEVDGDDYRLIMTSGFGRPFITAHDGVVLVVSDPTIPFDEEDVPGGPFGAAPQLVARSTDQGQTWTVDALGPRVFTGSGAQTGLGWTPEGGPDGTFVAAYAGTPETAENSGTADIVVHRSTDRGETWSEPLAIDDDDPADFYNSFYPQMGVAPNGRVDVVWQDNRDRTDFTFNVRYTYSTDGGLTWAENVLVSDQPLDFNFGVSLNSDIRQPPGVASANEYAAFGWADARFADEVTQTQDNFSAVAQFTPVPDGSSSVLPIVAAVFGGLAVAGIVLLVAQRVRRPSPDPAPTAAASGA